MLEVRYGFVMQNINIELLNIGSQHNIDKTTIFLFQNFFVASIHRGCLYQLTISKRIYPKPWDWSQMTDYCSQITCLLQKCLKL